VLVSHLRICAATDLTYGQSYLASLFQTGIVIHMKYGPLSLLHMHGFDCG
jgi:hypothetical protein